MEINSNINMAGVGRTYTTKHPNSAQKAGEDAAAFSSSHALEQALTATPEVRSEAVERARNLIADVKYPPKETLNKIAHLLAMNLDNSSDE